MISVTTSQSTEGRSKHSQKMLNNLHLNVLAVFSDTHRLKDPSKRDKMIDVMKQVFSDMRSFYKETKNNKKRIDDFKNNKFTEIDIHEIITRIFCNMTKLPETLNMIGSEDNIIEDIFDFLIKMSNVKKDNNFVKNLFEADKKKKKSPEELKRVIMSIVDNSMIGICNLIIEGDDLDYKNKFFVFIDKKFQGKDNIFDFDVFTNTFTCLEASMKEFNMQSVRLPSLMTDIKNKLNSILNK